MHRFYTLVHLSWLRLGHVDAFDNKAVLNLGSCSMSGCHYLGLARDHEEWIWRSLWKLSIKNDEFNIGCSSHDGKSQPSGTTGASDQHFTSVRKKVFAVFVCA